MRFIFLLYFGLLATIDGLAFFPGSEEPLSKDGQKHSISVKSLHDSSILQQLDFITYSRTNFDPNKFTIVYLPGGPGGASSERYANDFPKNSQLVMIDPRGTGLNLELMWPSPELLNTKQTVLDTRKIIEKLMLRNYVIWGKSYGTVTATILAHNIEREALVSATSPNAIILEGILSHAMNFSGQGDIHIMAKKLFSTYPQETKDLLYELKIAHTSKIQYLDELEFLYINAVRDLEDSVQFVNRLIRERLDVIEKALSYDQAVRALGQDLQNSLKHDTSYRGFYYSKHIVCNELAYVDKGFNHEEFHHYWKLRNNLDHPCNLREKHDKLYNADDYQISKTPILYLQGEKDYQTPLKMAFRHLNGQKTLAKGSGFFINPKGFHAFFKYPFSSCMNDFGDDLEQSNWELSKTFSCSKKQKINLRKINPI